MCYIVHSAAITLVLDPPEVPYSIFPKPAYELHVPNASVSAVFCATSESCLTHNCRDGLCTYSEPSQHIVRSQVADTGLLEVFPLTKKAEPSDAEVVLCVPTSALTRP